MLQKLCLAPVTGLVLASTVRFEEIGILKRVALDIITDASTHTPLCRATHVRGGAWSARSTAVHGTMGVVCLQTHGLSNG